jgi:hypothetical protein
MPVNVSRVVNSRLGENFTVERVIAGAFKFGKYSTTTETLTIFGPVSPMTDPKKLDMIPEGDRTGGAFTFWSQRVLYATGKRGQTVGLTSDVILWNNLRYRILQVSQRPMNGYYRAVGVREEGV